MGKKSKIINRNTSNAAQRRSQQQEAGLATPPVAQSPKTGVVLAVTSAITSPYVVSRYDFRRLPLWPNDGIE